MGAADHRTFLNIIVKSSKQMFVTIIQFTVENDRVDIQEVDAVDDPACEILRQKFQDVLGVVSVSYTHLDVYKRQAITVRRSPVNNWHTCLTAPVSTARMCRSISCWSAILPQLPTA